MNLTQEIIALRSVFAGAIKTSRGRIRGTGRIATIFFDSGVAGLSRRRPNVERLVSSWERMRLIERQRVSTGLNLFVEITAHPHQLRRRKIARGFHLDPFSCSAGSAGSLQQRYWSCPTSEATTECTRRSDSRGESPSGPGSVTPIPSAGSIPPPGFRKNSSRFRTHDGQKNARVRKADGAHLPACSSSGGD